MCRRQLFAHLKCCTSTNQRWRATHTPLQKDRFEQPISSCCCVAAPVLLLARPPGQGQLFDTFKMRYIHSFQTRHRSRDFESRDESSKALLSHNNSQFKSQLSSQSQCKFIEAAQVPVNVLLAVARLRDL